MNKDKNTTGLGKQIWITELDKKRLMGWIAQMSMSPDKRELPHIKELMAEINRAVVIGDSKKVPADVITMRSRVRLRNMNTEMEFEYSLVYPSEADVVKGHISVLAPLGTAMLGHRAGMTFNVDLPAGITAFKVEEILYQPEAAGDYHL